MSVNIRNEQIDVDVGFLEKTANQLVEILDISNFELSILVADNKYIANLNRKYLNKNVPTDVLAFSMQEGKETFKTEEKVLGDVIISAEMAKLRSKKLNIDFNKELVLYLVHGVLHLLGYKDDSISSMKAMEEKQNEILKTLGF